MASGSEDAAKYFISGILTQLQNFGEIDQWQIHHIDGVPFAYKITWGVKSQLQYFVESINVGECTKDYAIAFRIHES